MSETSTPPTGQASSPRQPHDLGGLLLELIITLLTPMFLAAGGGNLTHARAAATETLASYRTQTQHDLITVAKIIAFGLATLASLSRSMEDDLTVSQILRLRSNANATDRSEHRNRQALEQSHARQAAEPLYAPELDTTALVAAAQALQQQTAENLATFTRQPAPAPQAPQAAKTNAEMQYAATWAASAALVAAETAASLDLIPPNERRGAAIWVDVLNDLAKDFTQNGVPPRPKPGDIGALFRGA
jgi:hypothetical protein